jgi:hypothetical protein
MIGGPKVSSRTLPQMQDDLKHGSGRVDIGCLARSKFARSRRRDGAFDTRKKFFLGDVESDGLGATIGRPADPRRRKAHALCLPDLFRSEEGIRGSAESNAVLAAVGSHDEALKANGQLVFAQALALPAEAMTVHVRDGKMSATDGPFMETKEMLGGLTVIEAPDLNAAVQLAAGIPFAQLGSIEVRPVPDYTKPRPKL